MGIVEIMDIYKTSSCFFLWRLIAHNFPKSTSIYDNGITVYAYIDEKLLCQTKDFEIYAVMPYYQFNNVLNQSFQHKQMLNDSIRCIDGTNIILAFNVDDKYRDDYQKILSSKYNELSKQYVQLGSDSSVANQAALTSSSILEQWSLAAKILKCDLEQLIAPKQVYPYFLKERETYVSDSSIQSISLNI